jgi:signal transduction histidine kinase
VITRLTATYLAIFACVLALLSFVAYAFVSQQYHSLLLPALGTPEGQSAYSQAMRRVGLVIAAFDLPLLVVVGIVSAVLARISVGPMLAARERERQFVADAAHGLRSPLATIATVAQAAGNTADEHSRASFDLISKTALDSSDLISELLTLARDPDVRLLDREPVDLGALGAQCATEFVTRAHNRGIALNVATTSAIVDGDARRLRELIRNLLDNALRHARTSVTLSVTNGTNAEVVVEDDGPGIPQSERERIFERFARGADDTEGSGLGLPIARWIAQAHEGSLDLDDRNAGARLVARLPIIFR